MATCSQCKVDHRGLCHQCHHNGKVAGDYKLSPCSRCQTAEALQQGHGRNASYEEMASVLKLEAPNPPPKKYQLDFALDVLREFIGLDAISREIVFRFLIRPESSLLDVANHLSNTFQRLFTLQAVHWRVKVMTKSPYLAKILERVDVRVFPSKDSD